MSRVAVLMLVAFIFITVAGFFSVLTAMDKWDRGHYGSCITWFGVAVLAVVFDLKLLSILYTNLQWVFQ